MTERHHPVVHIVVDVEHGTLFPRTLNDGTNIGLTAKAQKNYIALIKNTVSEFADRGIPTVWVKFPQRQSPPLSKEELESEQYIDEAVGRHDGPGVFEKNGFNAFDDGKNLQGTSLHQHLQIMGAKRIVITGGNADVCDLATAVGGVQNDYSVILLSDRLIGRNNRSGDVAISEVQVKAAVAKMINNPYALQQEKHPLSDLVSKLTGDDRKTIQEKLVVCSFSDFVSSLSQLEPSRGPQVRPTVRSAGAAIK